MTSGKFSMQADGYKSIRETFSGKNLFVTGGNGFLAKVLVYRLLQLCPDTGAIYLLLRPRKNKDGTITSPKERLDAMLCSTAFMNLLRKDPELKKKLVAIPGDLIEPNLGLKQRDLETLFDTVHVVIHSAATVKFDEHLKTAVMVNVRGTRILLGLCSRMKSLRAFIHMSTAYSNCHRNTVGEIVYNAPYPPESVVQAVECLDEAAVQAVTKSIISPWPNTYTFTKALAESLILSTASGNFPIAIVRPTIIGAAYLHPFPGFVDNFNGPAGLFAAIGRGALRIMQGDRHAIADVIPVDFVAGFTLALGSHLMLKPTFNTKVYYCGSGALNPITWGFIERASDRCFHRVPLEKLFRDPDPRFIRSSILCKILRLYSHFLPAFLFDCWTLAKGKDARMMESYKKLHTLTRSLEYFTSKSWTFAADNMEQILSSVDSNDLKHLNLDPSKINWTEYFENYCLGVKTFLLREKLQDLPRARQDLAK